jgi:hypothetical protein
MVLISIATLSALALAGCGVASASAPDAQRIVVTATKATPPPVGALVTGDLMRSRSPARRSISLTAVLKPFTSLLL